MVRVLTHLVMMTSLIGLFVPRGNAASRPQSLGDPLSQVRYCNRFAGETIAAKIAACLADVPSSGGTADLTALTGVQNLAADPFVGITKPVTLNLVPARYVVNTNLTVPPNIALHFEQGAIFEAGAGIHVEIQGAVEAPATQIFGGPGKITISSTKVNRLLAEWFAGAPDLGAQVSAAAEALPSTGGVIEASDLAGARTINSVIKVSKPIVLLLGSGVFRLNASPLFAIEGNGTVSVHGTGRAHTIIDYPLLTGAAVSFLNARSPELQDLTISASNAMNSATGVSIVGSEHTSIRNVRVAGFRSNLSVTGYGANRSFDTRVIDTEITNCTSNCVVVDHAVDTFFTNVLNWAVKNNPTNAWALTIDTGASGVYIQSMSVAYGGVRIQNSSPSAAPDGMPPEYLFANQLIVDTVVGSDGILLDSSLDVADAAGRRGKSYHFTNCWSSFSQTDGRAGILIAGGEDISFTDFRIRLNRFHGVHVRGGREIRFSNGVIIGNNQQNAGDGDGVRVGAGVSNWHFDQVRIGNSVAGESGNQKYGIRVEPGVSTAWTLAFVNLTGNVVGPLLDGSANGNKTKWDLRDYGRPDLLVTDLLEGQRRRLELGDANFFLDYHGADPDSVTFSWDANAYFRYNRPAKSAAWLIDGSEKLRVNPNGVSLGTGAGISKMDSTTSSQNFRAINANSCIDSPPIPFSGASAGDTLIVTAPATFMTAMCGSIGACLQVSGYISARDEVKIRACNISSQRSASIPADVFRIELIKH